MGAVALLTGWTISASMRPRSNANPDAEAIDGADSLLPRFNTPAWLDESRPLLRVFGAPEDESADNEKNLKGLPFPLGYIVDISDLVVRFNARKLDGKDRSREELYELALANLRDLAPVLSLPKAGCETLRDEKGHAAARVLLVPALLKGSESIFVATPSRELLLLWSTGDAKAAKKARKLFDASRSEDAPIPEPVRVTPEGFEASKWSRKS